MPLVKWRTESSVSGQQDLMLLMEFLAYPIIAWKNVAPDPAGFAVGHLIQVNGY